MMPLFQLLDLLLSVAFFIMITHIILSWLINFNVLNLRQPIVHSIWDGLTRLLEPIYTPIRRMLPDTGALDLAPLVAFIALIAIQDIFLPALARSIAM
jgi:YggT family protein